MMSFRLMNDPTTAKRQNTRALQQRDREQHRTERGLATMILSREGRKNIQFVTTDKNL
jgi:hypothetical protein